MVRTMMSLEEIVKHVEQVAYSNNDKALICMGIKEYRQLAELLRELHERRKEPEIVECYECKHYMPVSQTSNSWGKCSIHSSPTEKQRTCQSCDYCSWAERRTDADD